MITVTVDGEAFASEIGELKTMGELIELIKATIDPDTIITEMQMNEKPVTEVDWNSPLQVHESAKLEIRTGSKESYLKDRLGSADGYLQRIRDRFSGAGQLYLSGNDMEANPELAGAVDDLLAFVNWYLALLSVDSDKMQPQIEEFDDYIRGLHKVCEELLQQQMFQSWQVLGETLQSKLTPQLEELRKFCQKNVL